MLSLAWLTVFIIFVYVPGSTLNVIERSSSLVLLSKSDSEVAASKLNKSSVVGGSSSSSSPSLSLSLLSSGDDDYAKEKLIFKTNNNKTEEGEIIELSDITATIDKNTTTTLGKHQQQQQRVESFKQEQVSDNAHSLVTKDPSPSLLLLSSLPSSLLNIELTHPTTSTTETPTSTSTAIRTTRTTITKPTTATTAKTTTTTRTGKAIRTWNNLNDFGNNKNYNGQRSKNIYGQHEATPQPPPLPPPAAQQQNRQHLQLALLSEGSGRAQQQYSSSSFLSSSSPGSRNTTTILPSQLTQSIQNTASVIIRGNSLNWGYVELGPSDSPPFSISSSASSLSLSSTPRTDTQTATRLPQSQPSSSLSSSTSSAASFGLSLSPGSSSYLYSSELPLMSFTSSAPVLASSWPTTAASPLSPTTVSSLSLSSSMSTLSTTSTTTARTTTSTTTRKPASDGYLNITSQAGTHAYLPCNVKQLVKKPISWLRVRDGHILTVDQTTFIADQRFQSIYTPNPERWSLQIKYVQTKDAGTYECQVSTEPKTSAIVSLNIVEPKTELIGESNRHVKAGSQVKLRCIISQALEPPLYINWYHNRQQIFLHNRKGWRTEIERDPTAGMATTAPSSIGSSSSSSSNINRDNSNDKQSTTIASLIIPSVSKKDSGNYTCSPSNSAPITVVLHVLNGEYSASAITSGSARSNSIKDIQGLFHLIPWVISFLMWYFGQMLALQPASA